eukprot:TRINITY_DN67675_c1_g4_i1.p1 TRINITY_DN67675_c1_g4~~TRINITY_DN67675_c1_g4_i1.p1  ORF type:complete len:627 (+),score=63.61 TRINITY_DN67675_c1_g4_i1:72-1952(+)
MHDGTASSHGSDAGGGVGGLDAPDFATSPKLRAAKSPRETNKSPGSPLTQPTVIGHRHWRPGPYASDPPGLEPNPAYGLPVSPRRSPPRSGSPTKRSGSPNGSPKRHNPQHTNTATTDNAYTHPPPGYPHNPNCWPFNHPSYLWRPTPPPGTSDDHLSPHGLSSPTLSPSSSFGPSTLSPNLWRPSTPPGAEHIESKSSRGGEPERPYATSSRSSGRLSPTSSLVPGTNTIQPVPMSPPIPQQGSYMEGERGGENINSPTPTSPPTDYGRSPPQKSQFDRPPAPDSIEDPYSRRLRDTPERSTRTPSPVYRSPSPQQQSESSRGGGPPMESYTLSTHQTKTTTTKYVGPDGAPPQTSTHTEASNYNYRSSPKRGPDDRQPSRSDYNSSSRASGSPTRSPPTSNNNIADSELDRLRNELGNLKRDLNDRNFRLDMYEKENQDMKGQMARVMDELNKEQRERANLERDFDRRVRAATPDRPPSSSYNNPTSPRSGASPLTANSLRDHTTSSATRTPKSPHQDSPHHKEQRRQSTPQHVVGAQMRAQPTSPHHAISPTSSGNDPSKPDRHGRLPNAKGEYLFPRQPRWCKKYDMNSLKEYYPATYTTREERAQRRSASPAADQQQQYGY